MFNHGRCAGTSAPRSAGCIPLVETSVSLMTLRQGSSHPRYRGLPPAASRNHSLIDGLSVANGEGCIHDAEGPHTPPRPFASGHYKC